MANFVVFDLETTGLDPKSDAIIEIALTKLDDSLKEIDVFESLVNPGMPIPEDAQAITGITNEDVLKAPYFSDIRDTVKAFIGDAVLVAHNADFDASFLREYGFNLADTVILDTFRLSAIAFSEERSMNLSSLSESLGYSHEWAHRALSDVRATAHLLSKIFERFSSFEGLEKDILAFLSFSVSESKAFSFVYSRCIKNASLVSMELMKTKILEHFGEYKTEERIITMPDSISASDAFSTPLLEERGEQRKMLELVEGAFEKKKQLLIEAPTGIGKTFAYGIPSILHAVKTNEKVIISTHTRTLQDQIALKDFPYMKEILASKWVNWFELVKLKGRSNYLSFLRFFEFLESDAEKTDDFFAFISKILFWLCRTTSGELDEISFYGKEFSYLEEVSAADARVLSQDNDYKKYEFLYRIREMAKSANLLLVNHALLLSELSDDSGGNLWKLSRIVVDEAHNLEDSATDALMKVLSLETTERELHHIENAIRRNNKNIANEPFTFPEFVESKESLILSFGMLFDFAYQYAQYKSGASNDNRPEYGRGRQSDVLVGSDIVLREWFNGIRNVLSSLRDKVHDLHVRLYDAPEKLAETFADPLSALEESVAFFEDFLSDLRDDLIRIVSMRSSWEFSLKITPLNVSSVLREKLWKHADTIILASATLSAGDDFEYVKKSLGLAEFEFHTLSSDFDYSKQALVFIPSDFRDVRKEVDRLRSIDFTRELIERMGGRTMCLFTSFASIREAHLRMLPGLKQKGIELLAQGMSGGKMKMIEQFKKNAHKTALLGTESFWEWVDIPGKDLELVVIQKLPFSVPTDPIVQARSRLYTDPFKEYSFPQMLLKLRQGMGRLIRTKEDKGIVVILDGRVNGDWFDVISRAFPSDIRIKRGEASSLISALDMFLARRKDSSTEK